MSIFDIVILLFFLTQTYWVWKARKWVRRSVWRVLLFAVYLFLVGYNFNYFGRPPEHIRLGFTDAVLRAPFLWWLAASTIGFLVALPLLILQGILWLVSRLRRGTPELESPPRRMFLEKATNVASAAPFVAGAYGLFYGRLNLETSHQRIRLAKLPRSFQGFRIVQLSDIHIGPFMPEEEIRKYVAIANSLKPDLIVLTGDFVTWDPRTQVDSVRSLSGVKAPFGVYGCLGNHDSWAGVEDSITSLFFDAGVHILRQQRTVVTVSRESINLIGVDFQSRRSMGLTKPTQHLLAEVPALMQPEQVNILLSHNPDTFDSAADLGVDLSLAGHTHGGQVSLEFISPQMAPSRIVTPYVSGWFEKPGGQLYVNRGIGTFGIPIRLGAPPEITTIELVRG